MPGMYCALGGKSGGQQEGTSFLSLEKEPKASTYAKNGQEDVDQQVPCAAALEEDAERREDHGEDDLADVAARQKSVSGMDVPSPEAGC